GIEPAEHHARDVKQLDRRADSDPERPAGLAQRLPGPDAALLGGLDNPADGGLPAHVRRRRHRQARRAQDRLLPGDLLETSPRAAPATRPVQLDREVPDLPAPPPRTVKQPAPQ